MDDTQHLMEIMWADNSARKEILATFFEEVEQGATRVQIEDWIYHVVDDVPGQRQLLFLNGVDLQQVVWAQITEFLCACFYAFQNGSDFPQVPAAHEWSYLVRRSDLPAPELHRRRPMRQRSLHSMMPADHNWRQLGLRNPWLAPYPHRTKPIKYTVPSFALLLEEQLLASGGEHVVYGGEAYVGLLLEQGKVFREEVECVPAESGDCHTNVARMWLEARTLYSIMVGYALSNDGVWRGHSWLWRNTPAESRLVETSERRCQYFGVVLDEQGAEAFAGKTGSQLL